MYSLQGQKGVSWIGTQARVELQYPDGTMMTHRKHAYSLSMVDVVEIEITSTPWQSVNKYVQKRKVNMHRLSYILPIKFPETLSTVTHWRF